jgi:porphobilinogen synthase
MRETVLSPHDLILPLFIMDSTTGTPEPVNSLPGVLRYTVNQAVNIAKQAWDAGIPCIAVFPCVETALKNEQATEAWNPNNLACLAIQAIKQACPDIGVMVDVALDLYTSHGHDGLLVGNDIHNDQTLDALVKQSLCFAQAGVDALGPSDMMDGRIGRIRQALEAANHTHTRIFAYTAKYASALYGPYRDAVGSSNHLAGGSKATYQQDPANTHEAIREALLDIQEGADMLMVKPASYYLDIIYAGLPG